MSIVLSCSLYAGIVYLSTAKPKVTYEDSLKKPKELKTGATLILTVNISGVPTPEVSWYFGEETIQTGNGTTLETTDTYSTLTIKNVGGKDSGVYSVKAENAAGSDSAEFTVVIKGWFLTQS